MQTCTIYRYTGTPGTIQHHHAYPSHQAGPMETTQKAVFRAVHLAGLGPRPHNAQQLAEQRHAGDATDQHFGIHNCKQRVDHVSVRSQTCCKAGGGFHLRKSGGGETSVVTTAAADKQITTHQIQQLLYLSDSQFRTIGLEDAWTRACIGAAHNLRVQCLLRPRKHRGDVLRFGNTEAVRVHAW
jgi:hypothetical protein